MVLSLLRYVSGQFFYINLFIDLLLSQGVIHKPRGQNFGYSDHPHPSWSLLLNKSYVKWSFGQPLLSPQLATWFMNDPQTFLTKLCKKEHLRFLWLKQIFQTIVKSISTQKGSKGKFLTPHT